MSRTDSATLPNLPVEIVHRIFDNLDGTAVLLSVRDVCRRLRATVDSYNRYELDLTTLSKRDFCHLLLIVNPKYVNGLTLNDRGTTPRQIDVFNSLIDIGLFTELRSLTLLECDAEYMYPFLEHVRQCSLTSLTLDTVWCNTSDQQRIAEHLSSIIAQPTLLRLRLLRRELCELIDQLKWPAECKLQYLRMVAVRKERVRNILLRASDLRKLDLGSTTESMLYNFTDAEDISLTPHSRLTSLIITTHLDSIETILSFLCYAPALRHLKIINTDLYWWEESGWEELIKTKLPALDKFEFYSTFCGDRSEKETEESTLHRLISPFRTPFWTEEKRWTVRCNWFLTLKIMEIYTVPICTSHYMHRNDPDTKTVSNFASEDRQSVISENVHQLHIAPSRPELVERKVR